MKVDVPRLAPLASIVGLRAVFRKALLPAIQVLGLLWLVGCSGPTKYYLPVPKAEDSTPFVNSTLQVGDQVIVTFPGATNLNMARLIRADGLISLGSHGDLKAVGKSAKELETEILARFGPELVVKEVAVSIEAAPYPVFITGAVLRPGKVMINRPITILEGLMEAGGFDASKADLRNVQVTRLEGNSQRNFRLDLQKALDNPRSTPFHLRPSDIVHVPEKFVFF